MSSDYFTAAPNMKAPEVGEGEVPAAASVGNCGSFKESLTCIISALKGTKYSFRGTTSIKCGDDKGEGSVSSQTGICFYGDVLNTFRRNTDLRKSLFVSVPVLEFVGDNSIEFVCAIGRDLGVSLYSFLTGHHPGFCWWDYTFDFRYKRVGKHFQKLGKLVVTLLYNLHVRGLYVGKDLLHLIYVKKPDKGYKSFSIALVGCSKETSYADGVWNDICGLKELVSLVQAKQPLLKRIEMAGGVTRYPTAEELFDLKIFHALIPAQKPTGEDPDKAIRDLSYFVNHTTLFWGSKEMFNFTTACYLLRESDECAFDDLINYEGYDEMVDDWGQHLLDNRMLISFKRGFKTRPFTVKIRPSNNLYESEEDLLRPSNNLYESRKGLVIYMRCILLHYLKDRREKLSRVGALAGQSYYNPDTQLWELFPYACPIIYAEVYKKLGQEFMPLAISSGLDYEIVA